MDGIETLLRAATVRVEGGPRPGAGFFVAPGYVVTCAHVIGDAPELTVAWSGRAARATRRLVLTDRGRPIPDLDADYPDVALLQVDASDHVCVALDRDQPITGDRLQSYGFPDEGGSVQLTAAALSYRGLKGEHPTLFLDLASDTVKPGMSGGALLNVRTSAVCGVLVATRNRASPDGGFAVPWGSLDGVLELVGAANHAHHERDPAWARAARPPGRRVRFRLPHRSRHFRGREVELAALHTTLSAGERAVVTQAIAGLGGVGKTALAAQYTHAHADEYDIVAWIRAEDGGIADLALLAAELGVEVDGLSPTERAERALAWLATCEPRWLLVLDNVPSPESLAGCCPAAGNGRVLITSRHRGMDQVAGVLTVDVLDLDTAADYLVARAGRPRERADARTLAGALGGLPLALAHAGAYCVSAGFADYRALLDLPADELFDTNPEAFYRETVASTWTVSIDAAARRSPLARDVLAMAAYLAPERIPAGLFSSLLADPAAPGQRKRLHDALAALHDFSLVDVAATGADVHRLLQKVVGDDAQRRADEAPGAAALAALSAAFPRETELPASWPGCEELLAHVLAYAATHAIEAHAQETVALLNRGCAYLYAAGDAARAAATAADAVRAGERLLGPDHPDTLTARHNLASSYWSAGRTADAITLQEAVLADRERLLGPDHPDTLTSRHNLASSYWSAGRTADAITLEEAVLADRERLLGPDHPDTLATRHNLASSYWSAGRTADAITLQEAVLADRERLLGPDHPDTLATRHALAVSYQSAGRTADAITLQEAVLADRERLLGPDHPSTLTTRLNLASSYQSAGRTADAIAVLEAVLADHERLLGPDHPSTLTTRHNLASSYQSAGRTADAITLQEAVLADRERLLGPDHPDTLATRHNLAHSRWSTGRTADAITLLEAVLADSERVLGPDHPQTIAARTALAAWAGDA